MWWYRVCAKAARSCLVVLVVVGMVRGSVAKGASFPSSRLFGDQRGDDMSVVDVGVFGGSNWLVKL